MNQMSPALSAMTLYVRLSLTDGFAGPSSDSARTFATTVEPFGPRYPQLPHNGHAAGCGMSRRIMQ